MLPLRIFQGLEPLTLLANFDGRLANFSEHSLKNLGFSTRSLLDK